jgi:hypothetical protein
LKILTLTADIIGKNLGNLFIHLFVLYATLGLGMVVTVGYAIRRLWQAKALQPARVTAPVVR